MKILNLDEALDRAHDFRELVKSKSSGKATLLPVTKGFPPNVIEMLLSLGLNEVGESFAKELLDKNTTLDDQSILWHMVGRVQRNKVKKIHSLISLWHSVDRKDLIDEISKYSPQARVLIQVDVFDREAQGGCSVDNVESLLEYSIKKNLKVDGLMTVGLNEDRVATEMAFKQVAKFSSALGLKEISMGMSEDFQIALDCGSTILRIGRGIFGERPSK